MSEFGKIHRKFWNHRKVKDTPNAALGLWVKANAWCRDNRSGGFVPRDVVLELGSVDDASDLMHAGLWIRVGDDTGATTGFRFKDYDQWNDDVEPNTEAGNLVRRVIPEKQPAAVRKQLVVQAAKLISEGLDLEIVEAALKLWLSKSLGPSLLPSLASEAMKDAQRAATLRNTINECMKSGQVTPLKPYGYVFTIPDPPDGLDVGERRAFMAKAKREWLHTISIKVAA